MTVRPDALPRRRPGTRTMVIAAVVAGLGLFLGANAHLIYVAVTSQPACVAFKETANGEAAPYRAAKAAC